MKKSILITGGAGFIGSNASRHFADRGWSVTILDSMSRTGTEKNIQWLRSCDNIRLIKHDIRDHLAVEELLDQEKPAVVLHLAAQVAVTTSVLDPKEDFLINASATLNLLESVREKTPETFVIFASTNKVYGQLGSIEIVEQDTRYQYKNLANGVDESTLLDFYSPYGCSKGCADQYVHDYSRIYGIKTVVFRQSCIYGPRQFGHEDQGWVAWFTIASLLGKKVTIFGDGKQIRDLLYVDDLCEAFEKAIYRQDTISGQAFNLGGGSENTLSLMELIAKLDELNKVPLVIDWDDWRPGDQKVFVSCNSKAQAALDWSPSVNVDDGVVRLHKWVKEHVSLFQGLV